MENLRKFLNTGDYYILYIRAHKTFDLSDISFSPYIDWATCAMDNHNFPLCISENTIYLQDLSELINKYPVCPDQFTPHIESLREFLEKNSTSNYECNLDVSNINVMENYFYFSTMLNNSTAQLVMHIEDAYEMLKTYLENDYNVHDPYDYIEDQKLKRRLSSLQNFWVTLKN